MAGPLAPEGVDRASLPASLACLILIIFPFIGGPCLPFFLICETLRRRGKEVSIGCRQEEVGGMFVRQQKELPIRNEGLRDCPFLDWLEGSCLGAEN